MKKFHIVFMLLYLSGAQSTIASSTTVSAASELVSLPISGQQANVLLRQLEAIVNTADKLAQSSGSYAAANISNGTLEKVLPNGSKAFVTSWGGKIVIGTPSPNQYPVTILQVPHDICVLAEAKLRRQ